MNDPRYSPTQVLLAERDATAMRRPVSVYVAIAVVMFQVVRSSLSLVTLWRFSRSGMLHVDPSIFAWSPVRLGILLAVCVGFYGGKNWSRWLLALFTLFSIYTMVHQFWYDYTKAPPGLGMIRHPSVIVNVALPTIAYLVALYLVYFPARDWFARSARQPLPATS